MPDWIVILTDEAGVAVTDAEVALVRESDVSTRFVHAEVIPRNGSSGSPLPLMTHQSAGTYRLPAPLSNPAGPWRLIVRKDRRHIVIQPVEIVASDKGGFATKPRNLDPKGLAVEVSAVEIKTVHANGDSRTTFRVNQLPHAEVVLMSGTQYGTPGEPLRTFAEGRRDALARPRVAADRCIDDGTLVTLWSIDDRATLFYARARGAALAWILVHRVVKHQAPATPITPGTRWPRDPNASSRQMAIHPDDLYGYLHDIGSSAATRGRVREVSIFSHAFNEGPILYDTDDVLGDPAQRDPNDFDCRTKDWERPTMASYEEAAKAMHERGRWHIWGCHTNPELVVMSASANFSRQQKKPPDELFAVNADSKHRRYEARVDRLRVLRRHLEWLTSRDQREARTYPGMLLGAFRCDVFAALPGTWANFGKASRSMFVEQDSSWKTIEAYHQNEPALKSVFAPSSGVDGERYANYRKYEGLNFPVVPARSAEYEFWFIKEKNLSMIRFHGGQGYTTSGHAQVSSERIADVGSIVSAHRGKSGHRYVLKQTPDTTTTAALVVETGNAVRVYMLDRNGSGPFDIEGDELMPP